jgi:pyruvate-formate lyase-activating enzyme
VSRRSGAPLAVASDGCGRVFEIPGLEAAGMLLGRPVRPEAGDWIPLPEGSLVLELPGRSTVAWNPDRNRFETIPDFRGKPAIAAAAFPAPAYLRLHLTAFRTAPGAPRLPLFAYSPIGWRDGRFWTTAERVDADIRHDPARFEPRALRLAAGRMARRHPDNRLVRHLIGLCVRRYACPNAQNFLLERWECPVPVSPACNAACAGCISEGKAAGVRSSQDRITFTPTVREILDFTVPHLEKAERPMVSFGQGCEGEPLLKAGMIEKSIRAMRKATSRGTIHLNTNAGDPEAVDRLFAAGLDSIRISLASARPDRYAAYHRPVNYRFGDVLESLKRARRAGAWISLNVLVLPGFTDDPEETAALTGLIRTFRVDLIQTRNLNMDPEWAAVVLGAAGEKRRTCGIRRWMSAVRRSAPEIRFGYFNPPKEDWGR